MGLDCAYESFGALGAGIVNFYHIIIDGILTLSKGRNQLGDHFETVFQVVADKESLKDSLVHEALDGIISVLTCSSNMVLASVESW